MGLFDGFEPINVPLDPKPYYSLNQVIEALQVNWQGDLQE